MPKPIYLDYMATTPVDPRVIDKMILYLGPNGAYGNPSSASHVYGLEAAQAIEIARAQVATSIHAEPSSIIFTSGATEANNLAILGAARFYQKKGRHLVTMLTEHKAVLDGFKQLEREGFTVTYLAPQANGLLDIKQLEEAVTAQTILVSIMQVNNEIGVIQDIEKIGAYLSNKGIIFHVDAAQSAGKIAINVNQLNVDLLSLSAHKNYGPKGIGALYIKQKPRIRILPLTHGGGQEKGLRPGTLATHQIVGMGEAFALSEQEREAEQARILLLRQRLWDGIKSLESIHFNGDMTSRIAGNLNVSFPGIMGDSLLLALNELAISTTSACTSATLLPSHVLSAIGLSKELCYSSIRLSIGRFTSMADIDETIKVINQKVNYLYTIKPL